MANALQCSDCTTYANGVKATRLSCTRQVQTKHFDLFPKRADDHVRQPKCPYDRSIVDGFRTRNVILRKLWGNCKFDTTYKHHGWDSIRFLLHQN